jgi:hypothetical protein
MVVSIVMAVFFNEWPKPVKLACLSIEGLLPAWWQQPSRLTQESAGITGHRPNERSK